LEDDEAKNAEEQEKELVEMIANEKKMAIQEKRNENIAKAKEHL